MMPGLSALMAFLLVFSFRAAAQPSDPNLPAGDTGTLTDTTGPSTPPTSTTITIPPRGTAPATTAPGRNGSSAGAAAPGTTNRANSANGSTAGTATTAPGQPINMESYADAVLTRKIERDLLARDPVAVRDVTVQTRNGTVYLRGSVPSEAARDMVFGIARGYADELPVRNEITIR